MVLEYNSTGSPELVIERFEERFQDRQPPCTKTVLRNLRNIRHMGLAKTEILKSLEDDEPLGQLDR